MVSSTETTTDVTSFVQSQKQLLELEREEEVQQASLLADTQHSLKRAEKAGVRFNPAHATKQRTDQKTGIVSDIAIIVVRTI